MARALRVQYSGAYYHVTCRGNERKKIFQVREDRETFLEKLALSAQVYHVSVLAYVLMTNHFHLLITTPQSNLSEFMRHFNICYTSAFNRRHNRVGHLYQGRYKALLIDADNYLLEVSRYIHCNPIRLTRFRKEGTNEHWERLLAYADSSLTGYFSVRKRKGFIDYGVVLGYMGGDNRKGRNGYRKFVQEGIGRELENPLLVGKGSGIVGGEAFLKWVQENLLSEERSEREQPALRELRKGYEPERLIKLFCEVVGSERGEICKRGKRSTERAMLMELLHRHCGISQPEIGRLVGGVDYSAVSQARGRLQKRLKKDRALNKKFNDFRTRLDILSR